MNTVFFCKLLFFSSFLFLYYIVLVSLFRLWFSGSGTAGYSGDGGIPTAALLYYPTDVAADKWGNVYFTDYQNSAVRFVNTTSKIITSVTTGLYTSVHYTGDAGPASLAKFYLPFFLTMDPTGQALYIGDSGNNVIRSISLSTRNTYPPVLCPSGQAWFSSACTTGCCSCQAGNYCPGDNYQYACLAGTYFTTTGNSDQSGCLPCASGSYSSVAGSLGCTICPAGKYAHSTSGAAYCIDCPVNTYNSNPGASDDSQCTLCNYDQLSLGGSTSCSYAITNIAGTSSSAGFTGDGGFATSATLNYPNGLILSSAANPVAYIADSNNGKIRVMRSATKRISSIVFNAYTLQTMGAFAPYDLAFDNTSTFMYVADLNNAIRRINFNDPVVNMTRFVGNGTVGGCSSDNTLAPSKYPLRQPGSIAMDSSNNIFIADTGNHRVVKYVASTMTMTVVAGATTCPALAGATGDGTANALLNSPWGVAVSSSGALYIADTNNCRIRVVDPTTGYVVSNYAGSPNGVCGFAGDGVPATNAVLNRPTKLALFAQSAPTSAPTSATIIAPTIEVIRTPTSEKPTPSRSLSTSSSSYLLYIADQANHCIRVVKLAGSSSIPYIYTLAGTCEISGYSTNGGPVTLALFNNPSALAVDASGNVYVSDRSNALVRKIKTSAPSSTTAYDVPDGSYIGTVAGNGLFASNSYYGTYTSAYYLFLMSDHRCGNHC